VPEQPTQLIPTSVTPDPRYTKEGKVGNMRVQVRLHTNGFSLDLGGEELAWKIADMIRSEISQNLQRGRDIHGAPLPALKQATIERRDRRQRQGLHGLDLRAEREAFKKGYRKLKKADPIAAFAGKFATSLDTADPNGTLRDRFRLRGRGPSGKTRYPGTVDTATPFHESGLGSENVQVTRKSRDYHEAIWLVAYPSGGKARGLHTDDGRGARLFAVSHYGWDRMAGLPRGIEREIDSLITEHHNAILQAGSSLIEIGRIVWTRAEKAAQVAEQAAQDDY
jgi:hypothetical protein